VFRRSPFAVRRFLTTFFFYVKKECQGKKFKTWVIDLIDNLNNIASSCRGRRDDFNRASEDDGRWPDGL
jgi:hypothetical protein